MRLCRARSPALSTKLTVRSNFLSDSHFCRFCIRVILFTARFRYSSSYKSKNISCERNYILEFQNILLLALEDIYRSKHDLHPFCYLTGLSHMFLPLYTIETLLQRSGSLIAPSVCHHEKRISSYSAMKHW